MNLPGRILLGLLAFTPLLLPRESMLKVSHAERENYIRRAAVWMATDIPKMDLSAGPQSNISVSPGVEVACQYSEPESGAQGYAPKFECTLPDTQEMVRIKYSGNEVLAEVAGTRLLWALGFYTDENYPVRVRCAGCPQKNPFHPAADEPREERVFEDSEMERSFPGLEIGEYHDQGWAWKDLDDVDEKAGGAGKAQIDALKLLAVFIQHTDSKHQQQRLGCYAQDLDQSTHPPTCKKPVLMIQDLGQTFGGGAAQISDTSSMNLQAWKSQPIWSLEESPDSGKCVGNLTSAAFAREDGLSNPQISEDGRAFLANLLNQLSDQQIRSLFQTARAEKTGASVDDWLAVFRDKRDQITHHHCGG